MVPDLVVPACVDACVHASQLVLVLVVCVVYVLYVVDGVDA